MNAYHRDVHPDLRAGFRSFIIADQTTLPHEPGKGSLDDPSAWQDLESSIGALDDLDLELCAQSLDPLGERIAP